MLCNSKNRNQRPFLSIVIPAYNEEQRLFDTLEKINNYLSQQKYEYEIIVVDDGSTDETVMKVKKLSTTSEHVKLLVNKTNRGKGYTVKKGMMRAQGRYVIFSDADLSTPIEEAESLLKWVQEEYDIAIASRGMQESDVRIHQSFSRESMGKIYNFLVQLIVLKGIKDTQCGFKCFKREVIQGIFERQRITRFSFDVEILYIAKKMGYTIKEVPVRWYNEPNSRVRILKDSVRMLLDLLKIRYNGIRRLYE